MRYEDDIDAGSMSKLMFHGQSATDKMKRGRRQSQCFKKGMLTMETLEMPEFFCHKDPSETACYTYCCIPGANQPTEHITSDIGSIGDLAASAEVALGTILQRTYAVLGARMHYGHPDIMNKLLMIQQGGVSEATKTINLFEDICAGMHFTMRGRYAFYDVR